MTVVIHLDQETVTSKLAISASACIQVETRIPAQHYTSDQLCSSYSPIRQSDLGCNQSTAQRIHTHKRKLHTTNLKQSNSFQNSFEYRNSLQFSPQLG